MKKDDATWLKICYAAFGIMVAYTTMKAIGTLGLYTGWAERYFEIFPIINAAISVTIGVLSAWGIGKKKERHEYFLGSISELRKVTWPSMIDTRRMTIVVCVVVGVFAVILGVFDVFWGKILKMMLS